MTVAASRLIERVRNRFGDASGNYLTNTVMLDWIDNAQQNVLSDYIALKRMACQYVSSDQEAFTIPDDSMIVEIVWHMRQMRRPLDYISPDEFFKKKIVADGASGYPVFYTILENKVYVWPRYSTAGTTTTLTATLSTTATSLSVATSTGLQGNGWLRIDSEDFEYTVRGTSGTVSGLTRGSAGTTAATHASAATVSQLDLMLYYRRRAASLSTTSTTLDLPDWMTTPLEEWLLYLGYMAEGSREKAEHQYRVFDAALKTAADKARQPNIGHPLRVQNVY